MLLLLGLLGVAFAGLGYRLVDLQVLRHDELARWRSKTRNTNTVWRRAGATFSTRTAICWRRAFW